MLPKIAQISRPEPNAERRSASRRVITFGFDARETRGSSRILILDLSRNGMLVQTAADLAVGDQIQIEIPEAGLVDAQIIRRADDRFGAMFDMPITQGAVSAVLLASPAEPGPLDQEDVSDASSPRFEFDPVLDRIAVAILAITALVVVLFVYALSFLPVSG